MLQIGEEISQINSYEFSGTTPRSKGCESLGAGYRRVLDVIESGLPDKKKGDRCAA